MTIAPSRPAQEMRASRFSWAWLGFDVTYLLAMLVVTIAAGHEGFGHLPSSELLGFVVASWVPLLGRRRWPVAVLVIVAVIETLHVAIGPVTAANLDARTLMGAYQPVPLATVAAAFTLAVRRPSRRGWLPGGLAAITLLAAALIARGTTLITTDFVMFDLVVIATGAGVLVNLRLQSTARDERDRAAEIRREVVAERLRIARDLHDVLAHHLALVNAQAGVADYLIGTDPTAASAALKDITLNTRQALDELRATVGLLRQDDDQDEGRRGSLENGDELRPAPGLAQVERLLEQVRSSGTMVSWRQEGVPRPLSAGADLAVYRVLQEAVTNASKHAPGAAVAVTLDWRHPGWVKLAVVNSASPHRPRDYRGPGTGHGLVGMRERALAAQGTLVAQATSSGGFGVHLDLPTERPPT